MSHWVVALATAGHQDRDAGGSCDLQSPGRDLGSPIHHTQMDYQSYLGICSHVGWSGGQFGAETPLRGVGVGWEGGSGGAQGPVLPGLAAPRCQQGVRSKTKLENRPQGGNVGAGWVSTYALNVSTKLCHRWGHLLGIKFIIAEWPRTADTSLRILTNKEHEALARAFRVTAFTGRRKGSWANDLGLPAINEPPAACWPGLVVREMFRA